MLMFSIFDSTRAKREGIFSTQQGTRSLVPFPERVMKLKTALLDATAHRVVRWMDQWWAMRNVDVLWSNTLLTLLFVNTAVLSLFVDHATTRRARNDHDASADHHVYRSGAALFFFALVYSARLFETPPGLRSLYLVPGTLLSWLVVGTLQETTGFLITKYDRNDWRCGVGCTLLGIGLRILACDVMPLLIRCDVLFRGRGGELIFQASSLFLVVRFAEAIGWLNENSTCATTLTAFCSCSLTILLSQHSAMPLHEGIASSWAVTFELLRGYLPSGAARGAIDILSGQFDAIATWLFGTMVRFIIPLAAITCCTGFTMLVFPHVSLWSFSFAVIVVFGCLTTYATVCCADVSLWVPDLRPRCRSCLPRSLCPPSLLVDVVVGQLPFYSRRAFPSRQTMIDFVRMPFRDLTLADDVACFRDHPTSTPNVGRLIDIIASRIVLTDPSRIAETSAATAMANGGDDEAPAASQSRVDGAAYRRHANKFCFNRPDQSVAIAQLFIALKEKSSTSITVAPDVMADARLFRLLESVFHAVVSVNNIRSRKLRRFGNGPAITAVTYDMSLSIVDLSMLATLTSATAEAVAVFDRTDPGRNTCMATICQARPSQGDQSRVLARLTRLLVDAAIFMEHPGAWGELPRVPVALAASDPRIWTEWTHVCDVVARNDGRVFPNASQLDAIAARMSLEIVDIQDHENITQLEERRMTMSVRAAAAALSARLIETGAPLFSVQTDVEEEAATNTAAAAAERLDERQQHIMNTCRDVLYVYWKRRVRRDFGSGASQRGQADCFLLLVAALLRRLSLCCSFYDFQHFLVWTGAFDEVPEYNDGVQVLHDAPATLVNQLVLRHLGHVAVRRRSVAGVLLANWRIDMEERWAIFRQQRGGASDDSTRPAPYIAAQMLKCMCLVLRTCDYELQTPPRRGDVMLDSYAVCYHFWHAAASTHEELCSQVSREEDDDARATLCLRFPRLLLKDFEPKLHRCVTLLDCWEAALPTLLHLAHINRAEFVEGLRGIPGLFSLLTSAEDPLAMAPWMPPSIASQATVLGRLIAEAIPLPHGCVATVVEGTDPEESCCVCLAVVSPGTSVATVRRCGHVMHRLCACNWLATSKTCPMCRATVES